MKNTVILKYLHYRTFCLSTSSFNATVKYSCFKNIELSQKYCVINLKLSAFVVSKKKISPFLSFPFALVEQNYSPINNIFIARKQFCNLSFSSISVVFHTFMLDAISAVVKELSRATSISEMRGERFKYQSDVLLRWTIGITKQRRAIREKMSHSYSIVLCLKIVRKPSSCFLERGSFVKFLD